MILPRPRAYVDWAVPLDENGNEIGVCYDSKTYNYYLEWLADYLFKTDIPVPENQQKSLIEFEQNKGIDSAVFWLSDDWGHAIWAAENLEYAFLEGVSYEDIRKQEQEAWNNVPDDEKELYENPEEEFFTSESEYNRIGREALEAKTVPEHIKHADIAYRAIFSNLLKKVGNKEERIAHLDYFYKNFYECASK